MRRHNPIIMLMWAFVLAFTFAIAWVVVMTWTLPPSDMAYGQRPFEDPLVFPVMSVIASIAAIVTYPFLYFLLRDRRFPRPMIILATVVLVEILVVTPISAGLGFLGSFVAYFIGLFLAHTWSKKYVDPGYCETCGYDLRGSGHERCPECGKEIGKH